jgi:uncharacterized Rmd1/YagE family protein
MENKIGFFEEAPQQRSMTRLVFFLITLVALFVVVFQIVTTGHTDISIFISMMTIGVGLKLGGKYQETKTA